VFENREFQETAGAGMSRPEPLQEPKLSFTRLAAVQASRTNPAIAPQEAPYASQLNPSADRRQLHARACDYLNQVFHAVRNLQGFSLEPGLAILEEMVAAPPAPDELFIAALHLDDRRRFGVHHSVNVAVYAVKMAHDLGFDLDRQVQIGLAGLLHDVGMALIPENVVYKQSPLDPEELAAFRYRPNVADKILQGLEPEYAYLAECAAQVYERLDGSGYPRGLRADEIHEFAQIVGLLDLYEALVHSRPNRDKLGFFDAVKYIFKSCKVQFQRHYMKSLLRVFTVFPIHSYVQLNSEAFGRVIETSAEQPMRPRLQIIYDSQRRKVLTERVVSLAEAPLLNIVRSVSEKEIQDLVEGLAAAHHPSEEGGQTVAEPIV
jgi:HD-GYP domain-containing protein (c-di-GMP phosphodiesterase class II)